MRAIIAVGYLLIASCAIAVAQEKKPSFLDESDAAQARRCFDVVIPHPGGAFTGGTFSTHSILVNRCTGDTWMLDLIQIDKNGNRGWRWFPIPTASSEIVFPRGP